MVFTRLKTGCKVEIDQKRGPEGPQLVWFNGAGGVDNTLTPVPSDRNESENVRGHAQSSLLSLQHLHLVERVVHSILRPRHPP